MKAHVSSAWYLTVLFAGLCGVEVRGQVLLRDFGDAPAPYPTLLKDNGASHVELKGFQLGARLDLEADGQPNANATGDDTSPVGAADDEDGVSFTSPLIPGQTSTLDVVASATGRLDAWIDFNGNGSWADGEDRIFASVGLVGGINHLSFLVPAAARPGATFSRFRFSRQGDLNFTGPAQDGEVEDYQVSVGAALDFGDAPDPTYPTTLKNNGARHQILEGFHLGGSVDAETDGQPNATATGDDANPAVTPSDEDGVIFPEPLVPGRTVEVDVTVTMSANQLARLDAWIDFNANGSWADTGEKVFDNVLVVPGLNKLFFVVPTGAKTGDTYARFRLSQKGGLSFDGLASDGEVEDYQVNIETGDQCVPTTNKGTDFWLTFPGNYAPDPTNAPQLSVCLVGNPGIKGNVSVSGSSFSQNFAIPATMAIVIKLPKFAGLGDSNDVVLGNGVHVTASDNVAVFALDHVRYTTDGYLGLPTPVLGNEYIVQGYANVLTGAPELAGTQFALVACDTNTTVTITPSVATGVHPAGVPYNLTLNQGQTYQLRNTDDAPADLAGTIVTSDKPIAVFGSHMCANIPTSAMFFCDYVVEQLLPTQRWGVNFAAMPLATRNGDTYRCLASQDATTVSVNGVVVATLNRGQTHQFIRNTPVHITSDQPIYVAQYSNSSDYDGVQNADPFMLTVPPTRMFLANQMICTAHVDFPDNYINVVAPAGAVGVVLLDGAAIPAGLFVPIAASGFSGARLPVSVGPHIVSAPAPVGVSVYGFAEYDSYAWPGGLLFGDSKPPTVTCLVEDVTIPIAPSAAGICVALVPNFLQQVIVSDNCDHPERWRIEQNPAPGTPVQPGVHNVIMSARDSSGNVGTCSIKLTVVDTTTPTIQCPSNIVVNCRTPQGTKVTFEPVAHTQCGTPVDAVCDPQSGTVFPPGTTRVVCVAGTSAGQQISCAFSVIVRCLTISHPSFGTVSLNWTGGGVLQTAPAATGPWRDLIDVTSPFSVTVGGANRVGQGFFRVKN